MKNLLTDWLASSFMEVALLQPSYPEGEDLPTFHSYRINTKLAQRLGQSATDWNGQPIDRLWPTPFQTDLPDKLRLVWATNTPVQWLDSSMEHGWSSITLTRIDNDLVFTRLKVSDQDARQESLALVLPAGPANLLPVSNDLNGIISTGDNLRLQAVIDASPAALALLRPVFEGDQLVDFHYLIRNPQHARLTGISPEAMRLRSLLNLVAPQLTHELFPKLVLVALTGDAQRVDVRDESATGVGWSEFSLVRVGQDVLLMINDITRFKHLEAQLRQINHELEQRVAERQDQIQHFSALQEAIFSYAGLAIAATDINGIIQLVNPALEALTGYPANELIGRVTPTFLRDPVVHQQQLAVLQATIRDPTLSESELMITYVRQYKVLRRENTLLTKAGQRLSVLSTVSGLYDDQQALIGFVDIATDITPLKIIEETLQQAQQRSQLAIKAGKLGLWEWDLLTDELVIESEFFSYYGLPDKNVLHRIQDALALVHPDDFPLVEQAIAQAKQHQMSFNIEFRVVLPLTSYIHYLKVDGLRMHSECKSGPRMVGVVADRTAQRRAKNFLQASEKRYRSLVEHLKEAVFQTDATGLWTYLNPAWEEITGFGVDETLGKPFLEYIIPEDRARNQALFEPLILRQKPYCRHLIRYRYRAGGYRWVEVFAQPTLDDNDQITGTTGTLTDITDRKQTEDALVESEQRFRQIADHVDELFWIQDVQESTFLYVNPVFERYTGSTVETLYNDTLAFAKFIVEEDRSALVNAFNHTDSITSLKFRVHHQNGSIRWICARMFLVYDEHGVAIRRIGLATDATDTVQKEQFLEELVNQQKALNNLKSQFLATASHQFRTPLTAISSSIELVKHYASLTESGPVSALINKHVDQILHQIFSLNELIGDTLTLSQIDDGKIQLQLEELDLLALAQSLISSTFTDRADGRQVDWTVEGQPVKLRLDKKLFNHVLINLLSNAFKYSTTNPRLRIQFTPQSVSVIVSDAGLGIPKRDLPFVFSKFFRASNVELIKGTGLGLAICQDYVHLLSGLINVDSTEGVGSRFIVTLPLIG